MKNFIIAAALTGLAVASPLSAQGRNGPPVNRTPNNGRNSQDCTYSQPTNTVGDIIFGRSGSNTTNCRNTSSSRGNGSWYPIGNDGNGNTIYERQTRDSNGNVIVQRARRDAYGNMSVFSSRNVGNNGTYNNRQRGDNDDQGNNGNGRGRGKWKKNKNKGNDDNEYNNDNDDNNAQYNSNNGYSSGNNGDYRYNATNSRYNNSERGDHGRGKGHKNGD
jgi:hypothetical protein